MPSGLPTTTLPLSPSMLLLVCVWFFFFFFFFGCCGSGSFHHTFLFGKYTPLYVVPGSEEQAICCSPLCSSRCLLETTHSPFVSVKQARDGAASNECDMSGCNHSFLCLPPSHTTLSRHHFFFFSFAQPRKPFLCYSLGCDCIFVQFLPCHFFPIFFSCDVNASEDAKTSQSDG